MLENPGKNVHAQADGLYEHFGACPKYIRTVRTMLVEGCPQELIMELRAKCISPNDAKKYFDAFHSGEPIEVSGSHSLYFITLEGEETTGKVGITNDITRRFDDLQRAYPPLVLRFHVKFHDRPSAGNTEDKVLLRFSPAGGGNDRRTEVDALEILRIAIPHGGRWVPVTRGFDVDGRR